MSIITYPPFFWSCTPLSFLSFDFIHIEKWFFPVKYGEEDKRVANPASCVSRGQISEHQSHIQGSPQESLSSVGKQTRETDKKESDKCAAIKKTTWEKQADLCFHGNQLLPWVKVSLLHLLFKSLGEKHKKRFITKVKNELIISYLLLEKVIPLKVRPKKISCKKNNHLC